MGLNYRNELLHGFELETNETTAALLFVGIIYLARAVGVGVPEPDPRSAPLNAPSNSPPLLDDVPD